MLTSFGSKSYTEGYKVYTTLDTRLQGVAGKALREAVIAYDQRHSYHGAEQNLGRFTPDKLDEWQDVLQGIQSVNNLKPAAVINTGSDNSLTVLLGDGRTINIPSTKITGAVDAYRVARSKSVT